MLSSIYVLFKMVSAARGTLTGISRHVPGPQTGLGKEMNSLQIPRGQTQRCQVPCPSPNSATRSNDKVDLLAAA